ncbi:MAG: response regulator [Thiohalomonadales bacterium]
MATLKIEELQTLLVEPSTAQNNYIVKCLNKIGIQNISQAADGKMALQSMEKNLPDLVVSAMHLQGMTGTELVQTMRMEEALKELPFMLISSETNYRYLEPIRQAGVIAILPKPFDVKQLQAAIDATIQYISPGELQSRSFNGEDLSVLVVDDSFTARRHISRVLKNMGIEKIIQAENGVEALEIIGENYFDIIVTDYNMPKMDGLELVEHIRNNSNQSSIPILMVSSESDESRLASVQKSGVSAICDKPFDAKVVKDLLVQFLE